MKRPRPGVQAELLPVALILLALGGTLALVIATHRKAAMMAVADKKTPAPAPSAVPPPEAPSRQSPAPPPPQPITEVAEDEPAPPPPAPVEDPTRKALARLSAQADEERQAIAEADRRATSLEKARGDAEARSKSWRRRESLVKAQVDEMETKARDLEAEADSLALERDVLLKERDAAKAALAKAMTRGGGYSILPHRSANGTWQRPVVLECKDASAILQPKGLTFSLVDLSPRFGTRSSPFIAAVGRELIRVHRTTAPDGDPVVPYIYFIVRPDGIRAYYEARARLEPLGMAFGYELVDQETDVEFPDFDDLDTWDGTGSPRNKARDTDGPGALARGGDFVWPADREAGRKPGRGNAGHGQGSGTGDGPEKFMWPTQRPGQGGYRPVAPGSDASGGLFDSPGHIRGTGPGGAPPPIGRIMPEMLARDGADDPPPGVVTLPYDFPAGNSGGGMTGTGSVRGSRPLTPISPGVLPDFESQDRLKKQGFAPGGSGGNRSGNPSGPGGPDSAQDGPAITLPGGRLGSQPGRSGTDTAQSDSLVTLPAGGLFPASPSGMGSGGGAGTGQGSGGQPNPVFPGDLAGTGATRGKPAGSNPGAGGNGTGRAPEIPRPSSGNVHGGAGSVPFDLEKIASGLGEPEPPTPPGRTRIDPTLMAEVNDPFGDSGDGGSGGKPGPGSNGSSGASAGSGQPGSGSTFTGTAPPAGGVGTPSQGGGDQPGMIGAGMPSMGASSSSSPRPGDIRPRRSGLSSIAGSQRVAVEVPLELVVACEANGVVIHPGGYRLTRPALRKPGNLVRDLETIVHNHSIIDPSVRPKPRVTFLVEPGGSETYQEARRQTVLSDMSWPVTLRIAGPQAALTFPKERF